MFLLLSVIVFSEAELITRQEGNDSIVFYLPPRDDTTTDWSSFDATIIDNGGVTYNTIAPQVGIADLDFDGSTASNLVVTAHPGLNTMHNFTMVWRLRVEDNEVEMQIIQRGADGVAGNYPSVTIDMSGTNRIFWNIYDSSAELCRSTVVTDALVGNHSNLFWVSVNYTEGKMYCMIGINDTMLGVAEKTTVPVTNSLDLTIGAIGANIPTLNISEFCIFNKSLSTDYIRDNLMNFSSDKGKGIPCGNITAGVAVPPPSPIINNTLPNITIDYPTNFSIIDNSSKFPLMINGTVTIQNSSIYNITINNTNFHNDGNNTLFNFTFNGTFAEGEYHINLTANSTDGNETHEILIFTVDVTLPSLDASTFSGNHTLHYAHENITFQFNYSDNNQLFSINISTPEGDLFNITGLNGTSYIFNGSINASTYGIGRKNITTEFCDAHTAKKIGKWKYKKRWDKKIQFDNGLLIGPESVWGWQDVEVKKLKDSYIFTYYSRTFMVGATKRFIVEGEKSVFIYGNQGDYKGWVIVDNKRWVDHNLKNQPNAEYNIIRINEKKVIIEISNLYGTKLQFESAGDLNCVKENLHYYVFNYTATFSTKVIETTVDLINLQIDFKDIVLDGNGTLNYNGIDFNVSNFTSSNQLNLTINFTIPQVSHNTSNATFFWTFELNTSRFITINFTQLVNRVQLALCGSLTDVSTLNITSLNEQSPTSLLEASIQATFTTWTNDSDVTLNFTFDLQGATNYSICIFPNTTITTNAKIFYNTSGGFRERWFLRNAKLTENVSLLNLYNFNSQTDIDELRGILRDSNFDFFPSIYTELQRYYPAENIWRAVQMDQSDDFGNVLFHIIEGTQDYRLNFIRDTTIIDKTNTLKFLCDTDDICDVTFLVDDSTTITKADLQIQTAYDNETQIFQLNFTDTSGLTNSVRLRLTKVSGVRTQEICDTTLTASSGTISCDTTGYDGNLIAQIYESRSPETPFLIIHIAKLIADKLFEMSGIGKNEAGLWAAGISITLMVAGSLLGPIGTIAAYIFSLIVINLLGIFNFVTISFITLMAVMAFAIALILSKRRG